MFKEQINTSKKETIPVKELAMAGSVASLDFSGSSDTEIEFETESLKKSDHVVADLNEHRELENKGNVEKHLEVENKDEVDLDIFNEVIEAGEKPFNTEIQESTNDTTEAIEISDANEIDEV